jgi:hypothetical protein
MATLNVGTLQAILELRDTMSSGLDNAAKKMRRFGGQMTRIGSNFTKSVTLPIVAAGAAALASADTIDKAMRTIATGTGATGAALATLGESFDAVFREVPNSAQQVAQALADLNTITGATGSLLTDLTKSLLDASRVLGEDGAVNAKLFATALEQFNIPISRGGELLDQFFVIAQRTGASLGKLIGETNTYGSVLKNAGFTLAESAAVFGRFQSIGIEVSRVMPGLNAAFRRWAGENRNIKTTLASTVDQIRTASSETRALTIATEAFGAEGAQRMTTAIRQGAFALENLDDLQVLRNRATQSFAPFGRVLKQALLDFLPVIDRVAAGINALALRFEALDPGTKNLIVGSTALVAALGPLAVVVGTVTLTFGQLWPFFKSGGKLVISLAKHVGTFASRVVRLASPMGAAVTLFALLFAKSENFRRIIHALTTLISGAVIGTFKGLWSVISAVIEKVQTIAGAVMDKLAPAFQFVERLFGKAADALETFTDDGVQPAETATAALTDELEVLVPDLEDVETVGEAAADSVAALGAGFTTLGVSMSRARDSMLNYLNVQERQLTVSAREGVRMLGRFAQSFTAYGVEGKAATRGVGTALAHLSQNYRMAGLDALRLKDGATMLNQVFNMNKVSSEKAVSGLSRFKASLLGLRQGITGGNGIMGLFTKIGTGFSEQLGGLLSGGLSSLINVGTQLAMTGLQKLGPVLKTGFKRIWGGIKGFFGKDAEGDIRAIGKRFGFALSGEMASAIAHTAEEIGDKHTAFLLHLGEITEAQGGVMATGFQKVARTGRDLFSMVELGKITTTQAMRALGPVLKNLAANFDDAGAAGQLQFQELIQLLIKFGVEVDEIARLIGTELADKAINQNLNGALIDAAGNVRKLNGEIAKIPTQIDIDAEVHYQTRQEQQRYTGGMGGYSFRHGTGGEFVNFGSGTPAMLHGFERITPLAEASRELADLAEVNARLGSIERLLKDQPRAMQLAFSDSLSMVR